MSNDITGSNPIPGNGKPFDMKSWTQWRIIGWGLGALILLLPLIAMQFTNEVNWDATDFGVAAFLIASVGIAFELAIRKTGSTAYRIASGFALIAVFLLIWMNAAVGLIGSENNPANLLYGGVIAVGFVGALLARFQARGMARALFFTALAQLLVMVYALLAELDGMIEIIRLNSFFVALFIISALLFQQAARR